MNSNIPGLDIILGPMFSGKSTELLRRLSNVTEVGLNALYINSSFDDRNDKDIFSTHNPTTKEKVSGNKINMIAVPNLINIDSKLMDNADIIGVDEAQFFTDLHIVKDWVDNKKKRVIIAGLDGDYKQEKFGKILDLIPHCDSVIKIHALCIRCSKTKKILVPAIFTFYSNTKKDNENSIDIGGHDKYESLCRQCYNQN
jgi:thymidine kinase